MELLQMKILLLDGSCKDQEYNDRLFQLVHHNLQASGQNLKTHDLSQLTIAPCLGCFGCWFQTPGECVIRDDGRLIAKEWVQSDVAVFFTPIVFGGYSSNLKKALDRFIPNVLPFFRIHHNEIHHLPRYSHYPDLIFLGTLTEKDQSLEHTFYQLTQRNILNMCPAYSSSTVIYDHQTGDEIKKQLEKVLKEVKII